MSQHAFRHNSCPQDEQTKGTLTGNGTMNVATTLDSQILLAGGLMHLGRRKKADTKKETSDRD